MSAHYDGGPAFPVSASDAKNVYGEMDGNMHAPGMSLRDWFAGQALAATNPGDLSFGTISQPSNPWPTVAADCYRAADAMLAARAQERTT